MDTEISTQFTRVEKALSTLITSIATYNPSPQFATDLVAADASLSTSLVKLSQHQANSARIHQLRSTTAALDTQLRNTLTQLTATRAELLAIPSTSLPESANAVSYKELLGYARRISKFTTPASWREEGEGIAGANGANNNGGGGEAKTPNSATPMNGSTPLATPELRNGVLPQAQGVVASPQAIEQHTTALPAHLNAHLNPVSDFVPWPTEETIRRGALANIQTLLNEGIDPETFDPERVAELEAMTRERELEEEERRAREEEERRVEMERRMGGGRRGTIEEQPRVFTGLDMLEDDDDD